MNKRRLKTGDLYLTHDSMIMFLANQIDEDIDYSTDQMYVNGFCTKSLIIKNLDLMCFYRDFYYIFKNDMKIND